jgi:16S rRNA (adenine1518-N6/adenine1519-N6)-dimethyltransferase
VVRQVLVLFQEDLLRNTLRELVGEDRLLALGIQPTARAETLGVADYVRIANALTPE